MKRLIIVVCVMAAVALSFTTIQDPEKKGLGRVQKSAGKEMYVMCEPLREYEVIERLSTGLGTMLVGRSTIQKQMQEVINKGINKVEKGKIKDFDAAMTDDGDVVVLIKFKD